MSRNPEALQKTEPRRLVIEVITLLLAEMPHAHSISNLVLNGVPVPEDECAAAVAIARKEHRQ